jgi:ATP-dependent RNA helicase RhlE
MTWAPVWSRHADSTARHRKWHPPQRSSSGVAAKERTKLHREFDQCPAPSFVRREAHRVAHPIVSRCLFVARADKTALLKRVLRDGAAARTLVFTRTKHGANRLSEPLDQAGFRSAAIHGNKTQSARERALDSFRRGTTHVLVATDVAARGIDVDDISLVVNFDLPSVAESYVHRIGRTGRAGAKGRAISFCDQEEQSLLRDVERLIRRRLPVAAS